MRVSAPVARKEWVIFSSAGADEISAARPQALRQNQFSMFSSPATGPSPRCRRATRGRVRVFLDHASAQAGCECQYPHRFQETFRFHRILSFLLFRSQHSKSVWRDVQERRGLCKRGGKPYASLYTCGQSRTLADAVTEAGIVMNRFAQRL